MTAPPVEGAVATAAMFAALDAAYRAAVARTSLAAARAMLAAWASVDAANIAGSSTTWLEQSVELVLAGRREAARMANVYTQQVRRLSLPDAPAWQPPPAAPPNVEQIRNSLIYTGLATTARNISALEASLTREVPDDPEAPRPDTASDDATRLGRRRQLMADAIARAANAAVRHVSEGGRDQIDDNIASDRLALGWARTTKAGCCYFCALLASRGPIYKEDTFESSDARFHGPGEHKVHDSCGCGLRPWYGTEMPWPDRSRELDDLYTNMETRDGETLLQAWRRTYEASPFAQPANEA